MPLQENNTLAVHVHDACTHWLYVHIWKFTVDIYAVIHVGVTPWSCPSRQTNSQAAATEQHNMIQALLTVA